MNCGVNDQTNTTAYGVHANVHIMMRKNATLARRISIWNPSGRSGSYIREERGSIDITVLTRWRSCLNLVTCMLGEYPAHPARSGTCAAVAAAAECCDGLGRWSINWILPAGERSSEEFEDSARTREREGEVYI